MKTSLLTLILSLTIMLTFAQTSEHLTFKGVPIDGTLDEYVSKMKQSGFKHIGTENKTAILNGDFAGYKGCYVGVSTLTQKDLVHKISVIFPERETWSTLSGNYFDLKAMLGEKYGEPKEVVEKFDSYPEPRDDERKMYRVKFDNCKYYSIWETDNGKIQLSIDPDGVTRCFVRLSYFDKINGQIIKAKTIDDL